MLVAAVAAGLPLLTVANVQAADFKDVSMENFNNFNPLRSPMAQTFTPQHEGFIDRVVLRIATSSPMSVTVQIQGTSGGKPDGSQLLGTTSFTGSVFPAAWKEFPFSSPVHVNAGQLYAIVVTPNNTLSWYDLYSVNSTQPGVGSLWLWVNNAWDWQKSYGYDFAFQEWQLGAGTTPTPSPTPVNHPPTVAVTKATLSTAEGSTATNTGTYSDPDGDTVTVSASIGTVTTTAGNWAWSYPVADEVPGQTVTITATDSHSATATVSFTMTFTPVLPKATITSVTYDGLVLLPSTPVTFQGGFTDAGKADTHTSYFDFGDGSPEVSWKYAASGDGDTTTTYPYAKPGTYTVTYEVKDDDGDTAEATAVVKVLSPAQALGAIEAYVGTMSSLTQGEKNSLIAKYRAAEASATRGNDNATCGQLGAALNELSSLVGNGRLSATDASTLTSATWSVHRALGCTKVKLSWLNLTL